MICRLVFAFTLCVAAHMRAQIAPTTGGQMRVEGDRNEIDQRTQEIVVQGNARVSDGTMLLLADEIRYNQGTHVATAVGHIQFTRADVRLLADRLIYNRADGSFTAENIRLGSHPYFVEGFSASGTRDEITVRRARASYGEPGKWQPTINADTIVFSPGRELRSENVTIGIGAAQPVPIPRFDHSLSAPLIGTGSLNGGFRRSLGLFAEAAVHIPVTPGVRLGADIGLYSNRGIMVGPSGRYSHFKHPETLRGYFRSGYINDHGDKGTDNISGQRVPEHRAYAEWQHQQLLAPNLTLSAQAHWWKDPEVYRDFRSRAYFPLQEPDTFVESVYTGPNYFVSAFVRLQPNRFHRVQERLPEVRFDLLPFAVGNGFYQRLHASVALLREDPIRRLTPTLGPFPGGPPPGDFRGYYRAYFPEASTTVLTDPEFTVETQRLDAYYALERPFVPRKWLAITPVVGGRLTHYTRTKVDGVHVPNYLRLLGEIGADAVLRANGTFNYKNEQWKIDGLRHLVTPRLSYRYIPDADKGRLNFPPIDRQVFTTYLQPLGLGDRRNIDDLRATNTLRLAIDNILQTRDPIEGTRDLAYFSLAADHRFSRIAGQHRLSETHAELALMPARWLQFDLFQRFTTQNFALRELNAGITLHDAQYWTVRFSNNFLRDQIQDYLVDGRVRLNERLDLQARLHYDSRLHRFNEQTYGIVQNLGNTWLVSYNVSVYSGRRRESSFGFNVRIDTVRF